MIPVRIGKKQRSKYRNIPTVVDGIRFDSKREAARYADLKLLQHAGEIHTLTADKKLLRLPIRINGQSICDYEADFFYITKHGARVWEDTKGMKTDVYKLKKKLVKAVHGIDIQEV